MGYSECGFLYYSGVLRHVIYYSALFIELSISLYQIGAQHFHKAYVIANPRIPDAVKQLLEIVAATSYIFVLVGVNLLGYGIGVTGLTAVLEKFNQPNRENDEGNVFSVLAGAFFFLAIGVNIMRFLRRIGVS